MNALEMQVFAAAFALGVQEAEKDCPAAMQETIAKAALADAAHAVECLRLIPDDHPLRGGLS